MVDHRLKQTPGGAAHSRGRASNIPSESDIPESILQERDEALAFATELHKFLDQKKAEDLKLLYLEGVNPYFRFFLIATASSSVQLKTLVRDLKKKFGHQLPEKNSGYRPEDLESGWVILDFIDVIVHIFLPEERSFYNLERLWGDARVIEVDD